MRPHRLSNLALDTYGGWGSCLCLRTSKHDAAIGLAREFKPPSLPALRFPEQRTILHLFSCGADCSYEVRLIRGVLELKLYSIGEFIDDLRWSPSIPPFI